MTYKTEKPNFGPGYTPGDRQAKAELPTHRRELATQVRDAVLLSAQLRDDSEPAPERGHTTVGDVDVELVQHSGQVVCSPDPVVTQNGQNGLFLHPVLRQSWFPDGQRSAHLARDLRRFAQLCR